MNPPIWVWLLFTLGVLALLALDLGVFHRKTHEVSLKEAATWSVVWIGLSLLFNAGIYLFGGSEPALGFLTGYLIEKSLAVDNIFVFVLLFGAFAVPPAYQHRVLFWGVLGALVMRAILIAFGAFLIEQFDWILYLFGAFLVVTGIRMAFQREHSEDLKDNRIIRLFRRLMPVTSEYHGARFWIRENGRRIATPLLLALVAIEVSDLIFAVDSIPAIFAVTQDPFLVYTSNVFAILGLRSMYFLLAGVVDRFYLLKPALAAILTIVGAKMLLADLFHLPVAVSLALVIGILAAGVVGSLLWPKPLKRHEPGTMGEA